jgi:uncharacterized surface protein with fasciclin (FAS1) repeats
MSTGTMSTGTVSTDDTMSTGSMASSGSDTDADGATVGTAASTNPLLGTLSAALDAAGLTETLESGQAFTVFAPIDSAFAKLDPDQLDAALADPSGLLTTVLSYHVIPEQLSSTDLMSGGSFETVLGDELSFEMRQDTLVVNEGAAAVQCMDLPAANGSLFLIDTVLLPPSVAGDGTSAPPSTTTADTTESGPSTSGATDGDTTATTEA